MRRMPNEQTNAGPTTAISDGLTVHAVQTGTVAVRTRQRAGLGSDKLRLLNTLLDREWTEPLPILAWVIEHPEGVIVVDTGETARASEPGYFPRWHPYFRLGLRECIEPEDEIGPQLEHLGISPLDVRWVVLTHLHTDHAGGLHHFRNSDILVSRTEADHASGRMGRLRGYLNNRFPDWFEPRLVDFHPHALRSFARSFALTERGDVVLVPAPGHTAGHLAVVLETGHDTFILAGDSSYTEDLMLRGVVDGVTPDGTAARLTLERLRACVAMTPTVYLPSHDPGSPMRLRARRTVQVAADTA